MDQVLKRQLEATRLRMKPCANKGRTEREFQVGDQVFLKLQPYRKLSVALRRNFKFNPRFYVLDFNEISFEDMKI